jgi:hypothetical protein
MGTFTVTTCQVSGRYEDCFFSPGVVQPALLRLEERATTITGTAIYGEMVEHAADYYHPFTSWLEPDGRLRITTGWGQSPSAVTRLAWDLRLSGADRLVGTLTATHTWYKVSGARVSSGDVVVTRRRD